MEEINYYNIRRILKVLSSTTLPALLMETGIFNIEQLVHQKKLGFYHRINNMEENRLIKQVFHEQKEYATHTIFPHGFQVWNQ